MEDFKFEILFHAEDVEDAETQARLALGAFDDGFQEAWLYANGGKRSKSNMPIRIDPELGGIHA